jgi:hypothetical protein
LTNAKVESLSLSKIKKMDSTHGLLAGQKGMLPVGISSPIITGGRSPHRGQGSAQQLIVGAGLGIGVSASGGAHSQQASAVNTGRNHDAAVHRLSESAPLIPSYHAILHSGSGMEGEGDESDGGKKHRQRKLYGGGPVLSSSYRRAKTPSLADTLKYVVVFM